MIACFLSNISAKYYKNPSMLSRVIAKNVGDVFLRHSVVSSHCVCAKKYFTVMKFKTPQFKTPTQPFIHPGSINE